VGTGLPGRILVVAHDKIVELLLSKGRRRQKSNKGGTFGKRAQAANSGGEALHRASSCGCARAPGVPEQGWTLGNGSRRQCGGPRQERSRWLLSTGADVNRRCDSCANASRQDSWKRTDPLVRVLLSKGADVPGQVPVGQRGLQAASCRSHDKMSELLG